jgi:hypothetical protein
MRRRFCDPYRRGLTTRAALSDLIRRLESYADRLAERRR